ncbi:hypothetical protein HYC85_013403 [Camellia sinensis]|uniref:Uncharacterized protein n=1 Tax=Camellia sinensis TaxID=4442 RepID=A0A7J7H6P2_CAMSI|nr:hypothetical protein HYC85_013403 [Camellia sinensis]
MGGVIGGLIPFILNYHRGATTAAASVNEATYIGFMIFMSVGTLLSLAILHPSRVIRDDSSLCTNIKYSSISVESTEILKLFLNWRMLLLSPAAWASNFVHCYQFNNVKGVLFDLRTRGLTNMCYWTAQMIGSLVIGYIIDFSFKSRRVRGLVSVGIVGLVGTGIWVGGLVNQLKYWRHDLPKRLDFKDSGSEFAGLLVLARFTGSWVLWLMIPRPLAGDKATWYGGAWTWSTGLYEKVYFFPVQLAPSVGKTDRTKPLD